VTGKQSPAGRAGISADELECRMSELEAAQARYWAAVDDPRVAEEDLALAARVLDYAETCTREAIAAPVVAAEADLAEPEPEAGL
jgi:hypothetical protein